MATSDVTAANAAKFYGLSQGQVSSFTSSPDGSAISLLFDDFQAPARAPSRAAPVPTRSFTLASSPAAAGQSISFDIRGGLQNADGARIRFKAGDRQFQLEPGGENFSLTAQAPATGNGETRVEVSLELPASNATRPVEMLLVIDSIDVSLGACSTQSGKG
jgi:hypothetical protein